VKKTIIGTYVQFKSTGFRFGLFGGQFSGSVNLDTRERR